MSQNFDRAPLKGKNKQNKEFQCHRGILKIWPSKQLQPVTFPETRRLVSPQRVNCTVGKTKKKETTCCFLEPSSDAVRHREERARLSSHWNEHAPKKLIQIDLNQEVEFFLFSFCCCWDQRKIKQFIKENFSRKKNLCSLEAIGSRVIYHVFDDHYDSFCKHVECVRVCVHVFLSTHMRNNL